MTSSSIAVRGRFFVFAVLIMITASADGEPAPEATESAKRIDAVLAEASAGGDGYAVMVEIGGELVLDKGYGLARRDPGRPFTVDTIAQIGSLTKQFTAAAILTLAAEGQVELEAPLRRYLDNVPTPAAEVTLHELLTHSAGLAEYCGEDFARRTKAGLLQECLESPLLFEPGTASAYSNVGYSVLAAVIEAVSGQTLEQFLREQVLAPNGLEATGYRFPESVRSRMAHGYSNGRDAGNIADRIRALDDAWWNLKGNGGMQASARDMYRWYRALRGAASLSESVREGLTRPHSPWNDGVAEGYGWFFRDDGTGKVRQISHAGSDGVFLAYFWYRPEERVFLYFVGNSGEDRSIEVLRTVRTILSSSAA